MLEIHHFMHCMHLCIVYVKVEISINKKPPALESPDLGCQQRTRAE